jgi:hypothetical protein
MSAAAASVVAKPAKETTGYIVLRQEASGGPWNTAGNYGGTSAAAAIRAFLATSPPDIDSRTSFVAIPARSWHPTKAKVTTKTVVTLETA